MARTPNLIGRKDTGYKVTLKKNRDTTEIILNLLVEKQTKFSSCAKLQPGKR